MLEAEKSWNKPNDKWNNNWGTLEMQLFVMLFNWNVEGHKSKHPTLLYIYPEIQTVQFEYKQL